MEAHYHGYVLRSHVLPGSRHVVLTFTREGGKRQGVMRVTKQQPASCLMPLNLLNFVLKGKQHQDLLNMSQVGLESHNYDLASQYLGLTLLQHWGRLVEWSQPAEVAEPRVYRLIGHCLSYLRVHREPAALPAVNGYFEAWLLFCCGMLPKSGGPVVAADGTGDSTEGRALPDSLPGPLFQVTVEEFVPLALKLGSLARLGRSLGDRWTHFLSRDMPTRTLLFQQFMERGLS